LLAVSILKERLGKTAYAGIALIFMGLIILNAKTDNSDIFQSNHFVGNMLILGAAIFWALDNNISNVILKKGISIIRLIQIKSLIGGAITLAIVFVSNIAFSINLYQIPNLLLLSLGGICWFPFSFSKGNERGWDSKVGNDFFNIVGIWPNIRLDAIEGTHGNLEPTIFHCVYYSRHFFYNQKQL
jgi:hypothetical protein